ncbi:hypothetical protein ACFQH2_14290 [Natronoarchaeum sp. GCM10025703]|uniref:hypothetical protein n=1 Tax=Natronoarchaeum sp. GCM10025703 TaxID=3252685 RepID=UPI00361EA6CC
MTYLDDGVEQERTVELDYVPREQASGEDGRTLWPFALAGSAALLVFGGGALVWRQ